jgi:hypothetical protein
VPDAPPQPSTSNRAELLRHARRVDWRFLLPEAEFADVAYHGRPDPELAAALLTFSRSVTTLGDLDTSRVFDLVVLADPSIGDLAQAARLLSPRGRLYVELRAVRHRGAWLSSAGRLAACYARQLEHLGLDGVMTHWHYPNLASPQAMIPLGEPAAIRYALGRREGSRLTPAKVLVGRFLVDLGLFDRFIPYASVVGSNAEKAA